MIKALGRSDGKLENRSGGTLPAFISANNLKSLISKDIEKGGQPINFRSVDGRKYKWKNALLK